MMELNSRFLTDRNLLIYIAWQLVVAANQSGDNMDNEPIHHNVSG